MKKTGFLLASVINLMKIGVKMSQTNQETSYFGLDLPASAGEVSNIFNYHRDKVSHWKMSNKPLRVYREGKVVAEFSRWPDIVKDGKVKNVIDKNSTGYTWFPTFLMHKKRLFTLYDSRFSKTEQGSIPVTEFFDIADYTYTEKSEEKDYRKLIGEIGEITVADHFKAVRSEDWYDAEKDGVINGAMTYEVKTFQLNHKFKGFLVEESQWAKLDGVDMLFFVRVPDKEGDLARAYLVINHKTCYHHVYIDDKKLRCYPLTNCLHQFNIDKEKSSSMLEMSKEISKWRK